MSGTVMSVRSGKNYTLRGKYNAFTILKNILLITL